MTYLFFIQGEGRGHLTQALTLQEKLLSRGHQVLAFVVGNDHDVALPSFFTEQITSPILTIASPGFVVDKEGRGIKIISSALIAIKNLPRYWRSIQTIKKTIEQYQPDVLVSFYEPLAGQYYRIYKDSRPLFCLGHQYFIDSPSFKFPLSSKLPRLAFQFYNRLTAPSHSQKIALSFTKENDNPKKNFWVCPPLIRREIKQQKPSDNNFLLIYLLNAGYSRDIINWSTKHPDIKIEAFWNNPEQEVSYFGSNLIFHHLSGSKFISKLSDCHAYTSTAGFDSIAEAAYLQKQIMMVPTKNHFEQKCNAVDATRAKIAITSDNFNLSLITQKSTRSSSGLTTFKEWVDNYDNKIVNILENKNKYFT
ncbi:UDP- glucuronosyltransferase [Candidatus Falkowbacteria bacterium]|uniref:UDP-glucuronosyltransferase n=1 Tax=Candidatus Falkowbacteria bacterium CG10_big_fil_rev_8_21_14_0_10_37_18 TaxID=1974562 RepID=A0A2H0V839_9BACT|nr:UDP- glucuronosyltransferase [Candidatus Falkowbacteria bacterium]NCQ12777.1 UDP- glucuronosyltransferase [Candidatus Falkowbacteria bacterium]PIR95274.1 MAG: UDP- glucuronosyltransferase [Candidatus Falkowbacteria bacterium CG10_big_fil_rev_8_21_14_0_10_37_18]